MHLFTDPVFLVEMVMLSAVLTVGFYTSYTDLKVRLVRNRHTMALLGIGLVGQLTMVALDVTSLNRMVAVVGIGLVIAFGLTLLGIWAPGDAKLFWAVVVAMPPSLCPSTDPFSMQAAPVALILNAFLCYLIVLLLVPLWRWEPKGEDSGHPDRPGGRQWLQAAWGLAGLLGMILALGWFVLERPLSYLEAFGALVVGYRLLERGLEARYWPVVGLPGLASLLYLSKATGGWQPYLLMLGVVWLIELVYLQVRHWHGRVVVQSFPVSEIRTGDVPRRSVEVETDAPDGALLCEAGQPLSDKQASRLRELGREGKLESGSMIELEQAVPFVPFIVSGALLAALFAGNLVPPLIDLVKWLRV